MLTESNITQQIIGKTLVEAQATLTQNGCGYRVSIMNGQPQQLTCDYRPDRINLIVENGVVVGTTLG